MARDCAMAQAQTTLYGIKNCDTIKKARAWLDARSIAYVFHDYRQSGIDATRLQSWIDQLGFEVLLNRSGTTFRALDEAEKRDLTPAKALALMLKQPAMIKRPVFETGKRLLVGFKPGLYEQAGLAK